MDTNVVQLQGRLLVSPSIEYTPDGARRARLLVLVRSEHRYRVDVIPVVASGPEVEILDETVVAGRIVRVCGALMRRCRHEEAGRLEVVADTIELPDLDPRVPPR